MSNALNQIRNYQNETLLDLLNQCTEPQQRIFKLMNARDNGKRSVEDAERMPIDEVVANMPEAKLSWAIQQCERTVAKNNSITA